MSTDPEGVPSSVVVFLTFESLNSDVYSLPASRASLSNHKCVVMVVFMMCLPCRVTSLPGPPGPTLPSDDVSGQEGLEPPIPLAAPSHRKDTAGSAMGS